MFVLQYNTEPNCLLKEGMKGNCEANGRMASIGDMEGSGLVNKRN